MDQTNSRLKLSQPVATIIAGAIIALVVLGGFYYEGAFSQKRFAARVQSALEYLQPNPSKMAPVTSADHVLGKTDAPVTLVVYTDFECPYCKVFHQSIKELEKDYIKDGKLSVVYRALPLEQLHEQAKPEAVASECVAKLGDNDKYWQYVDKIFTATKSNDGMDMTLLPKFAADLGIDAEKFESCTKDANNIEEAMLAVAENATEAGAQGTPYPIVLKDGKVVDALRGALPADQLRLMVDQVTAMENAPETN